MTDSIIFNVMLALFGVLIACCSQILLKKAALKVYDKWYRQYLNALVIAGYAIMLASTLCSVFAYRVLPISMSPVFTAAQQVFNVILCYLLLGERPNKRSLIGLGVIVIGILIFIL